MLGLLLNTNMILLPLGGNSSIERSSTLSLVQEKLHHNRVAYARASVVDIDTPSQHDTGSNGEYNNIEEAEKSYVTYAYFLIIYAINLTPCIYLKEEDTSSSKGQLKNYTDEGISKFICERFYIIRELMNTHLFLFRSYLEIEFVERESFPQTKRCRCSSFRIYSL